jgi:hypothetical protein
MNKQIKKTSKLDVRRDTLRMLTLFEVTGSQEPSFGLELSALPSTWTPRAEVVGPPVAVARFRNAGRRCFAFRSVEAARRARPREQVRWLDTYVKNAKPRPRITTR